MLDLLFGEAGGAGGARLIEEIGRCESCRGEWETMDATLRMVDGAAEVVFPDESFWAGYEERLRVRIDASRPPASFAPRARDRRVERAAYRLTLIEEVGLHRRLARQLRDVARESQLNWPAFKADPFGFTRRGVAAYSGLAWRFLSQRNVALATVSSFVVVCTVVVGLVGLERLRLSSADKSRDRAREYELIGMMPANTSGTERREEENGSPGRASGKGGGSLPEQARPHGGGGGGNNEPLKASNGKTPPASWEPQTVAPSPYPPTVKNPQLPLSPNLQGDPVLFPPDYRPVPYGDPRSDSEVASAGPGSDGGIGEGTRGGIGEGDGGGFGAGEDGNTGGGRMKKGGGGPGGPGGTQQARERDGAFLVRDVERKAVITSKPEPGFTEEARKYNVTGVVKLRLILKADGTVGDISVVKPLPYGLTERAITAAKRIQFTPAQRGGRSVPQWVTIEYNFNIY
jgi:protein TonB